MGHLSAWQHLQALPSQYDKLVEIEDVSICKEHVSCMALFLVFSTYEGLDSSPTSTSASVAGAAPVLKPQQMIYTWECSLICLSCSHPYPRCRLST